MPDPDTMSVVSDTFGILEYIVSAFAFLFLGWLTIQFKNIIQMILRNSEISEREDLRLYEKIHEVEDLRRETDKDIFRQILGVAVDVSYLKGLHAEHKKV